MIQQSNQINFVDGADHSYNKKEETLANEITNFKKNRVVN